MTISRWTNTWILTLFMAVAPLAGAGELCVDPANGSCFDTIQAAVDAANVADTITIFPRTDGGPYKETVVVTTADLTIQGAIEPEFTVETFEDLLAIDWSAERAACPVVIVDACETAELPDRCGFERPAGVTEEERSTFVIQAPGVTVANLTIRHAFAGVRFLAGSDGGAVQLNCFIHDRLPVYAGEDEVASVDDVVVSRNRIFSGGAAPSALQGLTVFGDGALLELNLSHVATGVQVEQASGAIVRRNAFFAPQGTVLDFRTGSGHLIEENWLTGGDDDGIRLRDVTATTVSGNRIAEIADNDEGIEARDCSGLQILDNEIQRVVRPGIDFQGVSDSLVQGNTVENSGSESSGWGCVRIRDDSSGNQILDNQLRFCTFGVRQDDDSGDANIYRRNVAELNSSSGFDVDGGDGTTIDDNEILDNFGEGLSHHSSATGSFVTDNDITGNQLDVCNDGGIAIFTGNSFDTGGETTPCQISVNRAPNPGATALGDAAAKGGPILCVDPGDDSCFATIQAAVDAASPNDTIEVRLPADGSTYSGTVQVDKSGLTIRGAEPVSFPVTTFDDLLAVDWLAERELCSPIRVDPCSTPTACNSESSFEITAADVTIEGLTMGFGRPSVFLMAGSDGATLELNCDFASREFIDTADDELVDDITIRRNRFFHLSSSTLVRGDGTLYELNLAASSDGIGFVGDGTTVHLNIFDVSEFSLRVEGDEATITDNFLRASEGLFYEGVGAVISGNRLELPSFIGGITVDPRQDAVLGEVPSSQVEITSNTILGSLGWGIKLEADNSVIQRNLVDDAVVPVSSSDTYDVKAGIWVRGANNQILDNVVLDAAVGIKNGGASARSVDGNTYGRNFVQRSGSSGLLLVEGEGTVVNANQFLDNEGEGFNNLRRALGTIFTNNTVTGNRTDVCNCGSIDSFSGNSFASGGTTTACVVERDPGFCSMPLFTDGFESGNTSSWSAVSP